MTTPTPHPALIVAADLLVRARLEDAARQAGVAYTSDRALPEPPDVAPSLLVLDLDQPGTLAGLRAWRERWPDLRVVGFLSHVDRAAWQEAEGLGCVVYPRGASARRGPEIIRDHAPPPE